MEFGENVLCCGAAEAVHGADEEEIFHGVSLNKKVKGVKGLVFC